MEKIKYKYNLNTNSFERVDNHKGLVKLIFKLLIFLAILFFIVGYLLVYYDRLNQTDFFNILGIVGGIASIAGLFSLFSKKISKNDIEDIGIEYFKEVVDTAEKLKEKEKALLDKEKQLGSKERQIKELELKKVELEFFVKKVSLTIFLKDQLERTENRIVDIVLENKEFSKALNDRKNLLKQLKELEEELESSNNSDLIDEINSMILKKKEVSVVGQPLIFDIIRKMLSI